MIEARSDTHLWSETYDRQINDIFAIQDEIAAKVTDQLKITLLGVTPKAQEVNPEAYSLYLQALYVVNNQDDYEQSEEFFKQALAIDPRFTKAWSGLSSNYLNEVNVGILPRKQGFALAYEAVEELFAIDPDNAEAQSILGWIAMRRDNDPAQAARHFQLALESEPTNTNILRAVSALLSVLNRQDQASALNAYLVARDPVNASTRFNMALWYYRQRHWEESIAAFRTLLKLRPNFYRAHFYIGVSLLFMGETNAALDEITKVHSEERRTMGMALVHHSLGRDEEYQTNLTELIERWGTEHPRNIARVYAFADDKDNAFHWLDQAVELQSRGINRVLVYPLLQNLHTDPRWGSFLYRIGSSPEQLNSIEFEVNLL